MQALQTVGHVRRQDSRWSSKQLIQRNNLRG